MNPVQKIVTAALATLLLPGAAPVFAESTVAPTLVVSAHRGGAAYAPENTMMAFRNAVRLGVDDLEADILLAADGELVLIHDDTLDRTTNCTGFVIDRPYAELQACDAAYYFTPGEPVTRGAENGNHPLRGAGVTIPRAAELLDYLVELYEAGRRVPTATVEIKVVPDRRDAEGARRTDPTGYATASVLVALLKEPKYALVKDRVIVQSFWPPALQLVKELDPTIRTLFLTTPEVATLAMENLSYAVAGRHEFVSPQQTSPDLTAEFVQAAQAVHKRVIPWTVDKAADLERVAALGVDGMITNFPACMLQLQDRLPAGVKRTPGASAGAGADSPGRSGNAPGRQKGRTGPVVPDTPACPE